jgi:hypothetical protein
MQKSEVRTGARDVVIQFHPVPPALARDMRTIARPSAGVPDEADSPRMAYLARLLATPYEIDQWRNPLVEDGGGARSS